MQSFFLPTIIDLSFKIKIIMFLEKTEEFCYLVKLFLIYFFPLKLNFGFFFYISIVICSKCCPSCFEILSYAISPFASPISFSLYFQNMMPFQFSIHYFAFSIACYFHFVINIYSCIFVV